MIKEYLSRKLYQIDDEAWGLRRPPVIKLSDTFTENEFEGVIHGYIEVWTPFDKNEYKIFLKISLIGINNYSDAQGKLSEAISKALEKHNMWFKKN